MLNWSHITFVSFRRKSFNTNFDWVGGLHKVQKNFYCNSCWIKRVLNRMHGFWISWFFSIFWPPPPSLENSNIFLNSSLIQLYFFRPEFTIDKPQVIFPQMIIDIFNWAPWDLLIQEHTKYMQCAQIMWDNLGKQQDPVTFFPLQTDQPTNLPIEDPARSYRWGH